jgi:hypothetical protein
MEPFLKVPLRNRKDLVSPPMTAGRMIFIRPVLAGRNGAAQHRTLLDGFRESPQHVDMSIFMHVGFEITVC